MKWLARLKNIEIATETDATKPTKPGFVGFVAPIPALIQEIQGESAAANDPAPDADRWCWPHSTAMTSAEIGTFTARLARFTDKGLTLDDGEALADRLVIRDRDSDDRWVCLECLHLAAGSWRCSNWQAAAVAIRSRDAQLPGDLVRKLQRCGGFSDALTREGVSYRNTI